MNLLYIIDCGGFGDEREGTVTVLSDRESAAIISSIYRVVTVFKCHFNK